MPKTEIQRLSETARMSSAERLRRVMDLWQLTQWDVAKELYVNQSSVSRWLAGQEMPSVAEAWVCDRERRAGLL